MKIKEMKRKKKGNLEEAIATSPLEAGEQLEAEKDRLSHKENKAES